MRLITMHKGVGEAKLDFYGCPLECKYCAHRMREKKDHTYDQVLKFLSEYETKRVFIGGAEPAMQKRELTMLIKILHKRGKEITLKTAGTDPDFLRDTLGSVHRYILEMKAPLDDLEGTMRLTNLEEDKALAYLENVRKCLEVLKGQKLRAMIRVIPTVLDREKVERMGRQLRGYAEEVQLIQFMSGGNDIPFEGISRPSPSYEEMEVLGDLMTKHVPLIIVQGDGFDTTLRG